MWMQPIVMQKQERGGTKRVHVCDKAQLSPILLKWSAISTTGVLFITNNCLALVSVPVSHRNGSGQEISFDVFVKKQWPTYKWMKRKSGGTKLVEPDLEQFFTEKWLI